MLKIILREEIESEFKELKSLAVGTEEYRITVEGLMKLVDRAIELDRLDSEMKEKIRNREIETDLKVQQLDDEKKDRLIRNCISVAGIAIPCILTVWGTCKSLKFEETGTVTTIVGRGFINKLLPKK